MTVIRLTTTPKKTKKPKGMRADKWKELNKRPPRENVMSVKKEGEETTNEST